MLELSIPTLGQRPLVEYCIDDGVAVVFGRIEDYTGELADDEMEPVWRAVQKRRNEFSTGRLFAKLAQQLLGYEAVVIRSAKRRPIWPDGMVGSISHSDRWAVVLLSTSERFSGLGIDMERMGRVTPSIARAVLTQSEIDRLAGLAGVGCPATLAFSAKEAVYKAVNPLVGLMIGFEEVEIDFYESSPGRYRARYIGRNLENRLIDTGGGSFEVYEDHVVTTFVIPS